jgi:hypothetical protein
MHSIIITGFLHRHPGLEAKLNLDSDHVIVDRKDWEKALFAMQERLEKAFAMVNEPTPDKAGIETQSAMERPDESETG